MPSIYDFTVQDNQGQPVDLSHYRGKVVLVVNTASKCGFTPQYQELETLHQQYHQQGLVILAFPCNQFGSQEPGDNAAIQQFCALNFGLSLPLMAKINVNGPTTEPLFDYLKEHARGILHTRAIKWNFTKFLINKQGVVVKRYAPNTTPASIETAIKQLLKN